MASVLRQARFSESFPANHESCANEHKIHRTLVNNFTDDVHRPALPYKFKFKVSGCPNDCMNSIERADMAVIGTWRDDMKVDQQAWKDYVAEKGRQHTIDNIISAFSHFGGLAKFKDIGDRL